MELAGKLVRFENCRILKDGQIIANDYLVMRDGIILDYMNVFFDQKQEPDFRINCKGALISPGLIDIQVNGGFGYDFSNTCNVEESLQIVSEKLLQYGVTGFCPTLVSSSSDVYKHVIPRIRGKTRGAQNLGIHCEGPFINQANVGAHLVDNLRSLPKGIKDVESMYGDLGNIKIITMAPELEGALDTIKELRKRNIIVSIGHSSTDLKTAEAAAKNGARLITHLFNAMSSFHHRDPGLLGLLTSQVANNEYMFFGLISDGCHTKPEAIKIAYRINFDGLVLVTDAISALGLHDGIHCLGNMEVEIRNECAYIRGTKTLCGSVTPLNKCVKLFNEFTNCGTVKALQAATLHPAQILGISHKKGLLNPGYDADFVMLNEDFEVLSTWIDGHCVFCRSADAFEIIS